MGGAAKHLALGHPKPARDLVEPDNVRRTEGGLALDAVAVDPADMVGLLPRSFHQVPQEVLLIVGRIHACTK